MTERKPDGQAVAPSAPSATEKPTGKPSQFKGHTPGPWRLERRGNGVEWDVTALEPDNPLYICCVNDTAMGTTSANAWLIAAAPDLLAENADLKTENDQVKAENVRLRGLIQGIIIEAGFTYDPSDPDVALGISPKTIDGLRAALNRDETKSTDH